MTQATFSHGAAQTKPDQPVPAPSGDTSSTNGSPNGTQQPFVQRVANIPIVSDTFSQAYSVIQSNSYSAAAYNRAESIATGVYNKVAPPVQSHLGNQVAAADSLANRSLDYVQEKFPIAFEPSNEIYGKARKPADDAAAAAKARLGPYTEQFSTQLTQAQTNLHTVQDKLASVVASLPRSPKDVQNTVHEVTASLLSEVEKIQANISGSAKGLPANVQSAVSPLFEQLQNAVSDIRAELNRSDVPLSTRAVNVLNYSRTNTEKALREALDRVATLLKNNKGEVEKTVDGAADQAKDAADSATSKANGVADEASKQAKQAGDKANKTADKASSKASAATDKAGKKAKQAEGEAKKATS